MLWQHTRRNITIGIYSLPVPFSVPINLHPLPLYKNLKKECLNIPGAIILKRKFHLAPLTKIGF